MGETYPTLCEACEQPMLRGQKYHLDHVNGGVLHATCIEGNLDSFTDDDGRSVKRKPKPLVWP